MSKVVVQASCPSCRGTGLYCGFAEPKGTAVVCNICNGSGAVDKILDSSNNSTYNYERYLGRKTRTDISNVLGDGGLWMTRGENPIGISYAEFCRRVPEAKKE